MKQIDITGGESIYCINESQLKKAYEIASGESGSARKIQSVMQMIEDDLTRNERAALAFLIINNLLNSE